MKWRKWLTVSTIEIKKIGITNIAVDAIVNAANEDLWKGGGVCGAIFAAAGSADLTKACQLIGHCDTGKAVITPAFKLPSSYVIHAVGPIWKDGNHNEPKLLYGAYNSSLELAKENNCHSIAFPLISAGIFGYPKDRAWKKAIQACLDFHETNPDYKLDVIFAVLDDGILKLGQEILQEEGLKRAAQKQQAQMTAEENQALTMWTMGLGDMNKLFEGESPLPEKKEKATKDSWNIEEMPKQCITIPAQIPVSNEAMDIIRMGHIPEVQEDHWFMYCDDDTIRYYRSWTGICVYTAHYTKLAGEGYVIDGITVNRNPEQYNETDSSADFELFMMLLKSEVGGDPSEHWNNYFEIKEKK